MAADPDPAKHPNSTRGILLVEDDINVRSLVTRVLQREGYSVIEASNGVEALERCNGYDLRIHLLITDVTMPLMSGPELVRQLLPRCPHMKVLFITGRDRKDLPQGPGISYLGKPFTLKVLLGHLKSMLS